MSLQAPTSSSLQSLSEAERAREILRITEDFNYFCDNYLWIQDKTIRRPIRFARYDCQREMSDHLVAGEWIICLKARQLGITWLVAAFCLWCLITRPMFTACVIAQNRFYAKGFISRVKFMYGLLPKWFQLPLSADSRYEFGIAHHLGEESELTVAAGGDTAGRSLTGDLIVFDEHARIPEAKETREACEPSLEVAGGQAVIISTSAGPYGDFYEQYQQAGESEFHAMFFGWWERPGRDKEWYRKQEVKHKADPLFVAREYPSNVKQAFMQAAGRCFPAFGVESHVCGWDGLPFKKENTDLYRAIDFGTVAAFACLWVAHCESAKSGFTVDPDCVNTIREFLAYHYDPKARGDRDRPAPKQSDHTCDALRYLIVGNGLQGHVHVYRELYVENAAALGRTDLTDILDIHRMSGWVEAEPHEKMRFKPGLDAEQFAGTVTDPSLAKTIELYNVNDLFCNGYRQPLGMSSKDRIVDGVKYVNLLIDATKEIQKRVVKTEEQLREHAVMKPREHTLGGECATLQEAAYRDIAKESVRAKRRMREKRGKRLMERYRPF